MPDDAALASDLLASVGRLRRGLRRAVGPGWAQGEMTGAQLELARLVRRRPGVSVNGAAEELQLASNTVSSLVGRLVDAGLLLREQDERDRRVARLDLAPEARRALEERRDARITALRAAMARVEPADRRALEAALPALDALVEALDV